MKKTTNQNTDISILEAAKNVFERKGMAGARMQEIADKAGINKAMLHYYYRSKQKLFEAVFKHAFNLMAPKLDKIINADIDLFEKIKLFSENYISFVIKHPYLPNFVIQELNRNPDFVIELLQGEKGLNLKEFIVQIEREVSNGRIINIKPEQLFINIMALNIFPFIAKPLLKGFINANESSYQLLLEERKKSVSEFIINAIKIKQ